MVTKLTEELLENLNKNPMFRLSLGSKELFHSNFLAFLWEQNSEVFLELINELCPKLINVKDRLRKLNLILEREKEKFDICIYHKECNKEIYDIIIENKVKSIPYIEQLKDYEQKVKNHQKEGTTNILLSLADVFPNKEDIIQGGWGIVSYDKFAEKLKYKKAEFSGSNPTIRQYIKDYISFIDQLAPLKNEILGNFEKSIYHEQSRIDTYHRYRLSDLYLKLRGAYFIGLLKENIEKDIINKANIEIKYFTSSKLEKRCREGKGKTIMIWLQYGMNRGKSTVTICINPANSINLYELQIEGEQYRHMFNQDGLVAKRDAVMETLSKIPYFDSNSLPEKLNNKRWAGRNNGKFNQYKPNCLYKYVKFASDTSVEMMMETIISDIKMELNYLQGCEDIVRKL